jgi:hypothetical protein
LYYIRSDRDGTTRYRSGKRAKMDRMEIVILLWIFIVLLVNLIQNYVLYTLVLKLKQKLENKEKKWEDPFYTDLPTCLGSIESRVCMVDKKLASLYNEISKQKEVISGINRTGSVTCSDRSFSHTDDL